MNFSWFFKLEGGKEWGGEKKKKKEKKKKQEEEEEEKGAPVGTDFEPSQ